MNRSRLFALPVCLGLLLATTAANAHISLEDGGTHKSRYGAGANSIKDGPCGKAGGKRGTNIYEYKPGETITITVKETLAHPGYFRIAFDQDGDDDFKEPQSIDPVKGKDGKPHRACLGGIDKCGKSDFNNNAAVLMDNLNPHTEGLLSGGGKTFTWKVKLPDVTCNNCTLQIIQVMEDADAHGPYSPKGVSDEPGYVEDIYHQCIDLVLKGDATGTNNPTPPATGDGDGDTGDGDTGDGDTGDGDDGAGDGDDSAGDGDGDDDQEGSVDGPGAGTPAASGSSCSVGIPSRRERLDLLLLLGLLGTVVGSRRLAKRRKS